MPVSEGGRDPAHVAAAQSRITDDLSHLPYMLPIVQENDATFAFDYISQVRWLYAKTMPDCPHEYTVKAWRPELSGSFEAFCHLVAVEGLVEPWPPPPADAIYRNRYLVIDDWKYWSIGPSGDADPVHARTVINRSRSDCCSPGQGRDL